MKFVRKKPKTKTYIDGNLVESYSTKATDEEIYNLNRKENNDENCGQRIVYRYKRDGTDQMVYPSVSAAARDTDTDRSSIRRCANGEYHSAGGYIWEWMEIECVN